MQKSVVLAIAFLGSALAQQIDKQQQSLAGKDVSTGELAAAESSSYGRYRSGGYGGSGGGGNNVDPRYFDRGDTPHFGLAGFPFGYERRYYGQNVVYDNSLAGFPLNYYNYQQDYSGNSYGSGSNYKAPSSSYKPQYRSANYASASKSYNQQPVEYGAYMDKASASPSGGNGQYYSLQYGYKK